MRNVNPQQLLSDRFGKILRTPNSKLRTCSRLFAIICIGLLLTGCGYQLVGKETHVPPGLSSIAIPTFVNNTFEPGIEVQFTRAFLREFIQDKRANVVDRKEADSILEGVIKSFVLGAVSFDRSGLVLEYQTTMVIDLTLKNRDGGILWKINDLSETTWYRASSSGVINEANKAAAIQEIGRFAAERVRNRFFYDF
jgi:outer membrane lipopolysaccharide assembly protein LptE/RlpB